MVYIFLLQEKLITYLVNKARQKENYFQPRFNTFSLQSIFEKFIDPSSIIISNTKESN